MHDAMADGDEPAFSTAIASVIEPSSGGHRPVCGLLARLRNEHRDPA